MDKLTPFKKIPNSKGEPSYYRNLRKGTQYVSMFYARGFNAAIREMERMKK